MKSRKPTEYKNPIDRQKQLIIKNAIKNGNKTYFTGILCKRGHLSPRYTISKVCVACAAEPAQREYVKFQNRNITKEEYNRMLWMQNGECAICKNILGTGQDVTIDHCHKTDIIRGLLCRWCNMGLGLFRDNITSLSNAAEYLKKFIK